MELQRSTSNNDVKHNKCHNHKSRGDDKKVWLRLNDSNYELVNLESINKYELKFYNKTYWIHGLIYDNLNNALIQTIFRMNCNTDNLDKACEYFSEFMDTYHTIFDKKEKYKSKPIDKLKNKTIKQHKRHRRHRRHKKI